MMSCKVTDRNSGNHGNSNASSSTKRPKLINFHVNYRLGYSRQFITMLEIIQVNVNDVTDEIDEFIVRDPGNYGNSNNSSNTKYPQFISYFMNNWSGHAEKLITIMKMIQVDMDNTEANDTMNIPIDHG